MGDADNEVVLSGSSKKKVPPKRIGKARLKKSSGTVSKKKKDQAKESVSNIMPEALHQSHQELPSVNSREKFASEKDARESLDAMLATEERKRKTSKDVSMGRNNSEEDLKCLEDSNSGSFGEVDPSEGGFGKNSDWENDFKTRVFETNSPSKSRIRRKRKDLLTHVHDVQTVSSLDLSTNENDSLADILTFFSKLQERVFEEDMSQSNQDEDCNDNEEDEGEIILYTEKGAKSYQKEAKEDNVSSKLDPTLDEILRDEEKERENRRYPSKANIN